MGSKGMTGQVKERLLPFLEFLSGGTEKGDSDALALRRVEFTAALGLCLSSAEFLCDAARSRRGAPHTLPASRTVGLLVHGSRLAAAGALASGRCRPASGAVCSGYLAVSDALLQRAQPHGRDGADQLQMLLMTALTLARAGRGDPGIDRWVLRFIAGQCALAYASAGAAKAASATWREGRALPGVLRTRSFGHRGAHRWAVRHPRATTWFARGVIAAELAFPLALVTPRPVTRTLLATAKAFHLGTAAGMGLNRFSPAFFAAHHAVRRCARNRGTGEKATTAASRGTTVLRAMTAAGLTGWLALTLAAQHPRSPGTWQRRLDRYRVLIPDWRFYSPEPTVHDVHLLYRDRHADGTATPWRRGTRYASRRARHGVWNPGNRLAKALADLAGRLGEPDSARLLLEFVVHGLPHAPDSVQTQFMVVTTAGYEETEKMAVLGGLAWHALPNTRRPGTEYSGGIPAGDKEKPQNKEFS